MMTQMTPEQTLSTLMQEWDRFIDMQISKGHSRAEAVVIVTALFNDFFDNAQKKV